MIPKWVKSTLVVLLIGAGGWALYSFINDVFNEGLNLIGVRNHIVQELVIIAAIMAILLLIFKKKNPFKELSQA